MRLTIQSDPLSVRSALQTIMGQFGSDELQPNDAATLEIVLAEVMNNIVEHAYRKRPDGKIRFCANKTETSIWCSFIDNGLPMPDNSTPAGLLRQLDGPTDELPEGGFGWFLIRDLAQNLTYSRIRNRNFLRLRLALDCPEGAQ